MENQRKVRLWSDRWDDFSDAQCMSLYSMLWILTTLCPGNLLVATDNDDPDKERNKKSRSWSTDNFSSQQKINLRDFGAKRLRPRYEAMTLFVHGKALKNLSDWKAWLTFWRWMMLWRGFAIRKKIHYSGNLVDRVDLTGEKRMNLDWFFGIAAQKQTKIEIISPAKNVF